MSQNSRLKNNSIKRAKRKYFQKLGLVVFGLLLICFLMMRYAYSLDNEKPNDNEISSVTVSSEEESSSLPSEQQSSSSSKTSSQSDEASVQSSEEQSSSATVENNDKNTDNALPLDITETFTTAQAAVNYGRSHYDAWSKLGYTNFKVLQDKNGQYYNSYY